MAEEEDPNGDDDDGCDGDGDDDDDDGDDDGDDDQEPSEQPARRDPFKRTRLQLMITPHGGYGIGDRPSFPDVRALERAIQQDVRLRDVELKTWPHRLSIGLDSTGAISALTGVFTTWLSARPRGSRIAIELSVSGPGGRRQGVASSLFDARDIDEFERIARDALQSG